MAEKEYIEREVAIEFVKRYSPTVDGFTTLQCVENAIKEIPAADVVAVVRCKDCVHYKQNQYSTDEYMMCKHWCDWLPTDPDDYCSYGKRKEQK